VRVVVRSGRLEIEYRHDLSDPHATETLSVPWTKPASKAPRAILMPSLPDGQGRRMESEERDRLLLAIASARSWLDGLIKGTIADLADLAASQKRTERSIRMTLSLASDQHRLRRDPAARLRGHASHGSPTAFCRSMARHGSSATSLAQTA
jgi:site-specific DNA recombinase